MTTATEPKISPISGYTTDERFIATRYKQGGRTVFLVALTPDQVINNIPRPNPDAPNPGNRRIRLPHARGFAQYYLEHDNWVIPGLILRAPAIFSFDETLDVGDDNIGFGVLSYPKRSRTDIQILDGQHRILGFHLALEMISEQIEKARDHRQRAERTEGKGSKVAKDAIKEIEALERKRDRFVQERVSVEIQITDNMQQYRQMFFDIADNALGITASVKALFDKRKVVNRALALVTEHDLLKNRVDPENDRLGRTGPYLLSARHVTEIIRTTNVGIEGRIGRVLERELNEVEVAKNTDAFLDMLVKCFPQIASIENGSLAPDRLRQTSLLGSPLFLRILAGTYYELRQKHAFTNAMVEEYFTALSQHMAAPVHANSIWIKYTPEETFNLGATGPNGRRQDIVNLSEAMWGWAVDKAPFVYAAPEPAPVPEVDEDEGIDFAPDHDGKAAGVQARNEAEEISTASRGRK
ncbi:DNA sulfur modification protein DndB [Microbacterium sp. zg-YB36]|uniref:DNA sulfur modification protein DndB n=1 Tax=Microbacterium sp. zg-YB36 TaxID=2969407 RepID=UPI00214C400F|nr:DNA sulfur modification protein DndB [Microbacterium sp. zg-YB36]MDL5351204.1 DNA sulfur modification protein DndB [Microbacterium sp. zg-YB36]